MKFNFFSLFLAMAALVALPTIAAAQVALPTADILAHITAVEAFILAVGGGVLGAIFVGKALKWARRAG